MLPCQDARLVEVARSLFVSEAYACPDPAEEHLFSSEENEALALQGISWPMKTLTPTPLI